MKSRPDQTCLPLSYKLGLILSAAAIAFWILEQTTGQLTFEAFTIPLKLGALTAGLAFATDLSTFLHRRPATTAMLILALTVVVLGLLFAFLPWRDAFAKHFGNAVYRWYYPGTAERYDDYSTWLADWNRWVPHQTEAALLVGYLSWICGISCLLRLSLLAGGLVSLVGYALLLLVPIATGLILWDYDIFLLGIACDSISMDLMPPLIWVAGDHSIFLYALLLSLFGVSSVFWKALPRQDVPLISAPSTPTPATSAAAPFQS